MIVNVEIRPLIEQDALISWRWRNDVSVWKYTGSKPDIAITPEIELDWIKSAISEENSKRFAILADGVYIGNIQLTSICENDSAQYHIFIGDRGYWGRGIAYKASRLILDFAKYNLNLKSVYLIVKSENLYAIKLYEKCGFNIVSDEIKMVINF
jgi:RimJ/RimL family protein N-acetyltransferase